MKTIRLITLSIFALAIVFILAASMPALAAPQSTCTKERYVSKWVEIPAQTNTNFFHNICDRPLEVHVWVGTFLKDYQPTTAVPSYDWPTHAIQVDYVSKFLINVHNLGEEPLFVQVVAVP
jgi:hypothetical protein